MTRPAASTDVAIIGAGPYGLSLAAHLRARGIDFRILGSPMRTWQEMPQGIALKSFDFATNIYSPLPHYTFVEWCRDRGIDSREPVDMQLFTRYGLWAQRELVPDVEDIEVVSLRRAPDGFALELANGERFSARRVVLAVGLGYFRRVPAQLRDLPAALLSHTWSNANYGSHGGRDVTVIGGGQSALEAAALLHDHGASVRMLVRSHGVWFGDRFGGERTLRDRILYPQTVLGPGRLNWVLQHMPALAYHLPERRRVLLTKRHLGPFGTWWLRDTIEQHVDVQIRTEVVSARDDAGEVALRVRAADGGEREIRTHHVVAGTGYEVDVDRITFLAEDLARAVTRIERAPRLSIDFESSVRGLYFLGPVAAFSFGPLLRFVCGAAYAAPAVARHLSRPKPRRSLAPEDADHAVQPGSGRADLRRKTGGVED